MQSGFVEAIGSMRALEDIQMRDCFFESKPQDVKSILDSLLNGCSNLRAIDISNNGLHKDILNNFLQLLGQRGSHSIESLALSEVNLTNESHGPLVTAISNLVVLRKLNLSGNVNLATQSLQQILRALIQHCKIEDLDLSRTAGGNGH